MALPSISVVTATLNCAHSLPPLIASLQSQEDRNFKWIVVDGCSTDDTEAIVRNASELDIDYKSEPDDGFYDALNKGIERAETDYYLVVGADDRLYPHAIATYRALARETSPDILAAGIDYGRKRRVPSRHIMGSVWSKTTNHSVGTLIRRELHDTLGPYSTRYSIVSDMGFLLAAYQQGCRFSSTEAIVGYFHDDGISSREYLRNILETMLVRVEHGHRFEVELAIMLARCARHYSRVHGRGRK